MDRHIFCPAFLIGYVAKIIKMSYFRTFISTPVANHDLHLYPFPVIDFSAVLGYRVVLSEPAVRNRIEVADSGGMDGLHPGSSFVQSTGVRRKRGAGEEAGDGW